MTKVTLQASIRLGLKSHPTNCFPQWIPIANLNYPNSCPMAKRVSLLLNVPFPLFRVPCHSIPIDMVPSAITGVWRRVNEPRIIDSWRQTLDQSCLKYGVLGKQNVTILYQTLKNTKVLKSLNNKIMSIYYQLLEELNCGTLES